MIRRKEVFESVVVFDVELVVKVKILHSRPQFALHSSETGIVFSVMRWQEDHDLVVPVQPLSVVLRVLL